MRRRFVLVFNARAGVAWPRLLGSVLQMLETAGATVTPLETESAQDATAKIAGLAREGGCDAVIAAGGDGTIRAAAAGLAGTTLPLGLIPLGTGNVMKYEIGLGRRARDIAAVLLDGPEIQVRGGTVNGAPFFLMVGTGFDGRIVSLLDQSTKRLLGRLAYGGPILRTLALPPDVLDVDIDGASHQASWAIVSNASRYGGSFVLTRDTRVGAEGLVCVLVKGRSRFALLRASLALALGRLADPARRPEDVDILAGRTIRITSPSPVPVEIDGDEGGMTPVAISDAGPSVRLIVPAAYVADLTNRHTNHVPLKM